MRIRVDDIVVSPPLPTREGSRGGASVGCVSHRRSTHPTVVVVVVPTQSPRIVAQHALTPGMSRRTFERAVAARLGCGEAGSRSEDSRRNISECQRQRYRAVILRRVEGEEGCQGATATQETSVFRGPGSPYVLKSHIPQTTCAPFLVRTRGRATDMKRTA